MALKVLLADDSMTAQNMGKKILTDAGYEVVAVSNGAAAVKKIASEKPDLVVLDVFMPGYTGLEVCERVRKAAETARTPVLLTYGKMEAFDPSEAERVKADGVIVKPFEASDLLAAVEKISLKAAAPPAAATPDYETTVKMAVPSFVEEFKDSSYEEWKSTAESHEEAPGKPRFEMSGEMASGPAFGMEEEPAPAPPSAIPDLRSTVAIEPPAEAAAAAPAAPEPAPVEPEMAPPPPPPAPAHHEVEFTSSPKAHEVEVAREPGLVTDASEMSQFVTKFGVENAEVIPVGIYEAPPEEAAPPAEAAPEEAAPAETAEAAPAVEAAPPAEPEPVPPPPPPSWAAEEAKVEEHEHAASLEHEMQQAFASVPVEAAPPEPEPPPPPPPPAPVAAPAVGDETEVLAAEMAAAMAAKVPEPPLPQGTTSLDSATISRIVQRAMEKLRPELEAEIARELAAEVERSGKP